MLTGVSLFAGVGGFDLAMQRQGVKVVASVEIDKNLINAGFTPSTGIITGGFPCQDLSVAGKRAGLAGERSGLFWEIARLVEETQTEYFIIENVPGLLSSNNGKDFGVVLGTMADLGYSLGWRVLDAQHFGVPQRRRRVFVVGRRTPNSSVAEILFKSEGLRRDLTQSKQEGQDPTRETPSSFGQTGFAKYTPGVTTLTATGYKRPEDNVVIGTLQARDYKGVGNQYVAENKLVVHEK
jgi:DNA (cytosine-5)-methyltransferase 1